MHFETCQFRAEVKEAKRRADLAQFYNPLDHVVVCPYAVVGCPHSCSRFAFAFFLLPSNKWFHQTDTWCSKKKSQSSCPSRRVPIQGTTIFPVFRFVLCCSNLPSLQSSYRGTGKVEWVPRPTARSMKLFVHMLFWDAKRFV